MSAQVDTIIVKDSGKTRLYKYSAIVAILLAGFFWFTSSSMHGEIADLKRDNIALVKTVKLFEQAYGNVEKINDEKPVAKVSWMDNAVAYFEPKELTTVEKTANWFSNKADEAKEVIDPPWYKDVMNWFKDL